MASLKRRAKASKDWVKAIASDCAEILQAKGIDPDPPGATEAAEAAGYEHPAPEWYAAEIVRLAHAIERQIAVGRPWMAARFGVELGRATVLGAITKYDHQAAKFEQGREEQARKKKAEANRWRIPAQRAAAEIWANNPNLSATAVAGHIQEKRGIAKERSLRSITNAISPLRPNKVGKTAQLFPRK
jgi:hypothetical protein